MKTKIVVPLYKNELSPNEELSFSNILKLYKASEVCLFTPESLKLEKRFHNIEQQHFEDKYFKNVMTYNKLMLSRIFYERFANYDYILVHQLDAFMFRKDLEYWCQKEYDYVGAPWLKSNNPISRIFRSKKLKLRGPIFNKVGNGGFSLRKVKTFLSFFETYENTISDHEKHPLYSIEDVFWSLIAPKLVDFKIPDYKVAVDFSIDRKPEIGLKLNQGQLPFGCHGFEKSKTKPFWRKYIKGLE